GVSDDEMVALVGIVRAEGPTPFMQLMREMHPSSELVSISSLRAALQAYLGPRISAPPSRIGRVVSMLTAMLASREDSELQRTLQLSWCKAIVKPVRALLVIDVQNDFIDGTLALKRCPAGQDAAEVVPVINLLRKSVPFDYVAISEDCHPQVLTEHCSFHETIQAGHCATPLHPSQDPISASHAAPFEIVMLSAPDGSAMPQTMWPRHCVQGTHGARTHKDLIVSPSDILVHKGTDPKVDSYSAFFDNFKINETSLRAQLEERGVTHVYCCGVALDVCVAFTATHAAEQGFITYVVEDACRGVSLDGIAQKKSIFERIGVKVVDASEVGASFAQDDVASASDAARNVAAARVAAQLMLHNDGHQAADAGLGDIPQASTFHLSQALSSPPSSFTPSIPAFLLSPPSVPPALSNCVLPLPPSLPPISRRLACTQCQMGTLELLSSVDELQESQLSNAEAPVYLLVAASTLPSVACSGFFYPAGTLQVRLKVGTMLKLAEMRWRYRAVDSKQSPREEALRAMARVCHHIGEDAELCEKLLLQALDLREKLLCKARTRTTEDVADTYHALGRLKQATGELEMAEVYFRRALDLSVSLARSPRVEMLSGGSSISLGTLYLLMSERKLLNPPSGGEVDECYAKALAFFSQARDIFTTVATEHPRTAWAYEGIALAHSMRGNLEAAKAASEEATRIRSKLQHSRAGRRLYANETLREINFIEDLGRAKTITKKWRRSIQMVVITRSLRADPEANSTKSES
ncbi:MAG: hypothetical protein SGPRY_002191, partial [Prymnesium sp.]